MIDDCGKRMERPDWKHKRRAMEAVLGIVASRPGCSHCRIAMLALALDAVCSLAEELNSEQQALFMAYNDAALAARRGEQATASSLVTELLVGAR